MTSLLHLQDFNTAAFHYAKFTYWTLNFLGKVHMNVNEKLNQIPNFNSVLKHYL